MVLTAGNTNLNEELNEQIRKAIGNGDCLNQITLRNRYLRTEIKVRIYNLTIVTYHNIWNQQQRPVKQGRKCKLQVLDFYEDSRYMKDIKRELKSENIREAAKFLPQKNR